MNIGIYIHIPFCKNEKCDYCDFYSVPCNIHDTHHKTLLNNYIKALCAEILYYSTECKNYTVDSIYFGGGTPSILSVTDYELLLKTLYNYYAIAPDTEITIECNPDDYSFDYIQQLHTIGINRVVIGVQTLDKKAHTYIGRKPGMVSIDTIAEFCSIPFIVPCIDIIVGIPKQTVSSFTTILTKIVQYLPKHISAYILTFEKNTPLSYRVPDHTRFANFQRTIFEKTIAILTQSGYRHYEISNFALPGYESRHNCKYWNFEDYIGFGSGAHSFYNNRRYFNKELSMYMSDPIQSRDEDIRSQKDVAIEYCMNKLRLTEGFVINDFYKKTGYTEKDKFEKILEQFINKGLLEYYDSEQKRIQCTQEGMFFLDSILFELMENI